MVLPLASPPSPPPDLSVILGPILLGGLFNWGLFGILGLQTYLYFHWFPKDRNALKGLVAILFALDTSQTVVSTHITWSMLVSGWGNGAVLLTSSWSFCLAVMLSGLISAIVQIFFAHRVWMLSESKIVSIAIIAISLAQCISAFTGATQVWLLHLDNSKLLSTFDAFALWLSSSAACDVIIACSMVYFLTLMKPKSLLRSSDTLISRLINNSIQSGVVTAICAGLELILFLKFKSNNLQDVPFLMLGKLYSNTLLANLNARRSLAEIHPTRTDLTDPASMRFWVQSSTHESRGVNVQNQTTIALDRASSGNETEASTANTTKRQSYNDTLTITV